MVQVREICLCLSNDQDDSEPLLETKKIPWPADALNRLCDRVELSVLDAYRIVFGDAAWYIVLAPLGRKEAMLDCRHGFY